MERNQKNVLSLYKIVKGRYLLLKCNPKFQRKDFNIQDQNSLKLQPVQKKFNNNRNSLNSKAISSENDEMISEKNVKHYYEEYHQQYKGNEKQFYKKHKNNLSAMKFLKHILFSQVKQTDVIHLSKRSVKKSNSYKLFLKKAYDFIKSRITQILFFLSIIMLSYNIVYHFQEIKIEKQILENYRSKFPNESEALYQIQREKHILYERIRRHKDLGILQSLLCRQINLSFSFFLGVLFLITGVLKNIYTSNVTRKQNFNYQNINQPIFEVLSKSSNQSFKLNDNNQDQVSTQNVEIINNESNNQNSLIKPSDLYYETKKQNEEKYLQMLKNQKEHILRVKEGQQIKRDLLEQKKAELMNEQKNLDHKQVKTTQIKNKKKMMNSLSLINQTQIQNQQGQQIIQEQTKFVSQYYNYEKVYQSEDEDYDLPQFGVKKNPLFNKFPKRSKMIVSKNKVESDGHHLHITSKSISIQNNLINTKNESESYKFCDRPF